MFDSCTGMRSPEAASKQASGLAANLPAAMLLQQQLNAGLNAPSAAGFTGNNWDGASAQAQAQAAIMRHQEDQLKMAQLLLQKRQLDDYIAASGGNSGIMSATDSSLLLPQHQLWLRGAGSGSNSGAGTGMGNNGGTSFTNTAKTIEQALALMQSGEIPASNMQAALMGMASGQMSSFSGGQNLSSLDAARSSNSSSVNFLTAQQEKPKINEEEVQQDNKEDPNTAEEADKEDEPDEEEEDEDEDDDAYYNDDNNGGDKSSRDLRTNNETFPLKLYRMIVEAEKNGQTDIVSFFPHGRAFAIHKPRDFVSDIMSKYFTTSRMSSFQRQLNLYGFRRITEGRDKGGYFHENFLKGKRSLCKKIKRKRTTVKAPPNFFNQASNSLGRQGFGAQDLLAMQHAAAAAASTGTGGAMSGILGGGADASSLLEMARQGLLSDSLFALHATNNASQASAGNMSAELMLYQLRQQQLQQELLLRGSINPGRM